MVDLEMRYILWEEGKEGTDLGSLSEDDQKEILARAKVRIATREGATGFLGFIVPAIPYFKDREQQDIAQALTSYRDTYNDWVQPQEGETQKPGWLDISRQSAQKDQATLRKKYVEYEGLFDYIDALATGDEDKFYEVGAAHPEVVAYFASLYNDHGDLDSYLDNSNYNPGGLVSWLMERDYGLHPIKDPAAYVGELADLEASNKHFTEATRRWNEFRTNMTQMGLDEKSEEYQTAKDALLKDLQAMSGKANPLEPYKNLGWQSPEALGLAPSPAKVAWDKEQSGYIKAEYDAALADVTTDTARAMLKREFTDRCVEEGLDPKILSNAPVDLPDAVIDKNLVLADVRKDPFGLSKEEILARGLPYDDSLFTAQTQLQEMKEEINGIVKQFGGSIWDPKYDAYRVSYQEYARTPGRHQRHLRRVLGLLPSSRLGEDAGPRALPIRDLGQVVQRSGRARLHR